MPLSIARPWLVVTLLVAALPGAARPPAVPAGGHFGGSLVIAQSSEPQTLNPVFAADNASRQMVSFLMADLMHINPATTRVEPALATGVDHVSPLRWIVHLRPGLRFSDGVPFTAADVVFSFDVYTDARLDPPQRALLVVDGKPVRARALDAATVEITLPAPLAVGDRMFDSLWMLPRHKLQPLYNAGKLSQAWDAGVAPSELAGLGPWMLQQWLPGQELRLVPNPNYWQTDASGRRLPYLSGLRVRTLSDPDLQLSLFIHGDLDGLELRAQDYAALAGRACCRRLDAGPGLAPVVLVLNQAPGGGPARAWFRQAAFRRGLSEAIDRANLVRNVFAGAATPLDTLTSPADGPWADPRPAPALDDAAAQRDFRQAGLELRAGTLLDAAGEPVAFSLIVPATNADRMKLATFVQEDLRQVGIAVQVVPLDFASYVDRLLHRRDYDAAILGMSFPDTDPNVESSVWTLDGGMHVWNPQPAAPEAWEREMDRLFRTQVSTTDARARLALYRRMQDVERDQLPMIPLVAPDVVAAVNPRLAGARAALLAPHLWWNTAELYWSSSPRP